MSAARQRLPNRRLSEHFDFRHHNLPYTCTFSRYRDGRVAEIFLTNGRAGSQSAANASDAAVAVSIALQFSAPIEIIRGALLRDEDGSASTPLGQALDLICGGDG